MQGRHRSLNFKLTAILVVGLACGTAGVARADVIVGLPADSNAGNCFQFGCDYSHSNGGSPEYQQVYTASQFTGPITITDLEFFNTQIDEGATSMNSGNWTISLSHEMPPAHWASHISASISWPTTKAESVLAGHWQR